MSAINDEVWRDIYEALAIAKHKHPDKYRNAHEGYGWITEEYREFEEAVLKKQGLDRQICEAMDLVCVTVRTLEMLYLKKAWDVQ